MESSIYERIRLLAEVDRRSIAEIAAMCAEAGLAEVEKDIKARRQLRYRAHSDETSLMEDQPTPSAPTPAGPPAVAAPRPKRAGRLLIASP